MSVKPWKVALAAAALALAVLVLAQGEMPRSVHAATGDKLRSVTADLPPCRTKGTGIAFDGTTTLMLDCWYSGDIDQVSPADGSSAGKTTIANPDDFGALSFDRSRNKLWACSGGFDVYLISLGAATAAFQFTSDGCTDGLAYDPTDDTIWSSCQDCDNLYHYTSAGAPIATFTGMVAKLGGEYGVSGIAVVGADLVISNGIGAHIYACAKDVSSCTSIIDTGRKTDDLECDDVTFAPKTAIWSQYPFSRHLDAWEVSGSCSGSLPPTATPTEEASATVTPQPPTSTPTERVNPTSTPQVTTQGTAAATRTVAAHADKVTPVSTPKLILNAGRAQAASTGPVIQAPNAGQGRAQGGASWLVLVAILGLMGTTSLAVAARLRP